MKYAVFDIGNVIAHVNFEKFISSLQEHKIVLSLESGYKFLEDIQPYQDLGLTNIRKEISKFNLDKKIEDDIVQHWMDTISFNPNSLKLIEDLKNENYKIALLSNIGFDHASIIRKNDLLNSLIQHFSFEIGARKPSKLYYQSFLIEYPYFKNCSFIDDRYDNLDMAENCGFKSYHFDLDKINTEEQSKISFYELKSFIKNTTKSYYKNI